MRIKFYGTKEEYEGLCKLNRCHITASLDLCELYDGDCKNCPDGKDSLEKYIVYIGEDKPEGEEA